MTRASKKSKSLAEQVADAGLVHKSGVCPLLLAAASVDWCKNRGNTAITPSISAWLHQQVLGITVTPRQVLDFLLRAAGAGESTAVVMLGDDEDDLYYCGKANGDTPTRFFEVSESKAWMLHCPDVDATVYTLKPLDTRVGPTEPGYEFHDRYSITDCAKDADAAWGKGRVSRVPSEYTDDDGETEAYWQEPDEDERNFAADVSKVFNEMLLDVAMVTRWAEANKLV